MKPRNREINIFNMSLLDVLCGALGAFCFLMLSLFPYYTKAGGSAAESPENTQKLKQELEQARAELQKALEQMSHMSQGRPVNVQELMRQLESAQQQWKQAAQRLQQAEQQLAQAQNKAKEEEKFANEIFGLTNQMLIITASWTAPKADVDLWIRNPNKTWEGPKKETPDGGKLLYNLADMTSGPGTEQDYYPSPGNGTYEVYLRLVNRGETPPQQAVSVHAIVTRLYVYRGEKDKKLVLSRQYQSWFANLSEEKKLLPVFIITLDNKGLKSDAFPQKPQS